MTKWDMDLTEYNLKLATQVTVLFCADHLAIFKDKVFEHKIVFVEYIFSLLQIEAQLSSTNLS